MLREWHRPWEFRKLSEDQEDSLKDHQWGPEEVLRWHWERADFQAMHFTCTHDYLWESKRQHDWPRKSNHSIGRIDKELKRRRGRGNGRRAGWFKPFRKSSEKPREPQKYKWQKTRVVNYENEWPKCFKRIARAINFEDHSTKQG